MTMIPLRLLFLPLSVPSTPVRFDGYLSPSLLLTQTLSPRFTRRLPPSLSHLPPSRRRCQLPTLICAVSPRWPNGGSSNPSMDCQPTLRRGKRGVDAETALPLLLKVRGPIEKKTPTTTNAVSTLLRLKHMTRFVVDHNDRTYA
jgi:hypothetical protein